MHIIRVPDGMVHLPQEGPISSMTLQVANSAALAHSYWAATLAKAHGKHLSTILYYTVRLA